MINGNRPTLGPNAGRKARKVDSARARRCFRWLGLACCTGWAQTRLSTTGIWGMSVKGNGAPWLTPFHTKLKVTGEQRCE